MGVRISRPLLDAIIAHVASVPERESCGLLFGDDDVIAHALPAANVHPDPARHFEVDPAALIGAHKAARNGGPRLIGAYHSHPSGSADASIEDAQSAENGQLCLILAGGTHRLYRAQAGSLVPVDLSTDVPL